jgi:hypothetical protein
MILIFTGLTERWGKLGKLSKGLTMLNAFKFILGAAVFYGSLWLILMLGTIAGF